MSAFVSRGFQRRHRPPDELEAVEVSMKAESALAREDPRRTRLQ
jgi:hypothetical protein